jgi:hypothetical protein
MSRLPNEIIVHVRTLSNGGSPLADLLVSLQLYWHGSYYYGDLIGLTDEFGNARITRDRILRDFDEDQRLFPMDYKVPIDQIDPVAGILVRGHSDFVAARSALEANPLVASDVRAAYMRARNEAVRTGGVQVNLPRSTADRLQVELAWSPSVS